MRYDDIFEKPIEEYTDDEIRARAMELRASAKLTKGKRKAEKTSKELTEKVGSTNETVTMLEQMINNAKKAAERNEGGTEQ
jgi:hypothetical protein